MYHFLKEFAIDNFAIFFIAIVFIAITIRSKRTKVSRFCFILTTIIIALLLAVFTSLEYWAAADVSRIQFRTIFSFIGFVLRPLSLLSLIYVLEYKSVKRIWLLIPEILNILVLIPCFFTEKVFFFDEEYAFHRATLGYFYFVVSFFYFLYMIYLVVKHYTMGKRREFFVLLICIVCSFVGIMMDILWYGTNINISIVICSICYTTYISSDYSGTDILTGLKNRNAFYEDSDWKTAEITSIATIDMNGLKLTNDTKGHDMGDASLRIIGAALKRQTNTNVSSYRVGGDEFMLIFRSYVESKVVEVLKNIREEVESTDVRIAIGYSIKKGNETLDELCKYADVKMYEDKKSFYIKYPEYDLRSQSL